MLFTRELITNFFPETVGNHPFQIDVVTTDSRQHVTNSLFIPLIGERFDGHQFIEQAISNGAVASFWDKAIPLPAKYPVDFTFILVDDTLQALQMLAGQYRLLVNPIVIGVTGSNGKTTTKDIIAAVLQTKYNTHKTDGNFNNHIGLPLTILSMPQTTEVLVVEMGMNNFGEIELLTNIALPNYAVITNIGESHIEFLGSRAGIAKAKLEIINGLLPMGELIIDGDEPLFAEIRQKEFVETCGFNTDNDIVISNISLLNKHTHFTVENEQYKLPLLGEHHAKNATFAIFIAKRLGVSYDNILVGLENLQYSEMRFEWLSGNKDSVIINDAYNASPTSMIGAINVMKQLSEFNRKIIVLGDILELGEYAKDFHLEVAKIISEPIDYVFTYGEHTEIIANYVKENLTIISMHFTCKKRLVEQLEPLLQEKTVVLFKGSRGMALEEIIQQIQ